MVHIRLHKLTPTASPERSAESPLHPPNPRLSSIHDWNMSDDEKSVSPSFVTLGVIDQTPRLNNTLNMLRTVVERVEKLLVPNKQPEVDPRLHFYKMFNQEADEHDRDFHKKYHDDLNTALIFVS